MYLEGVFDFFFWREYVFARFRLGFELPLGRATSSRHSLLLVIVESVGMHGDAVALVFVHDLEGCGTGKILSLVDGIFRT
jgi:hypothetical protein